MGTVPIPSLVINAIVALFSVVAWLQLLVMGDTDSRKLAEKGLGSLRYFTVLSNLLSGAASVAYLVVRTTSGNGIPSWLLTLKLVSAAAVMLTFLTVLLLLAPQKGWRAMYASGNLWLHLILPVLAALDCCLFVPVGTLPFSSTLLAFLPTAVYGVWYIGTVLVFGTERDGKVYDFYGFFQWGVSRLPVVIAVMLAASWVSALCMWFVSGIVCQ